jgi:hypothetical protein
VPANPLAGRQHDPVFMSLPAATVLIDTELVIRAATPTYLGVTGRRAEDLVDVDLFAAFPENPDADEPGTGDLLRDALEEALRRRSGQRVLPLRYDIPDARRPGRFLVRSWLLTTSPVHHDGTTYGISCRVQDVSPHGTRLAAALDGYADVLEESGRSAGDAEALHALVGLLEDHDALNREVANLRRAMSSRPVIEQAKGMLMADNRCGSDEAFALLSRLSQDHHVPVADVAAAIVYQASHRG